MEKFSVKKPFTVLVAVVMILILGFVAVTKMDTNLLPNVNTPYLMVVTVYPGASPERVESEVSDVLENALTVPGTAVQNNHVYLVQPDGTLKLPEGQRNIVIRTSYSDVQRSPDGTLRIASPVIQGNVNGNVTLYVEGKGVENITVLNSGR